MSDKTIYIVQFNDTYYTFNSDDEIYKYLDDACGYMEEVTLQSAYTLELNDFTMPALINDEWDTDYLECYYDEVKVMLDQSNSEYEESRRIKLDEGTY